MLRVLFSVLISLQIASCEKDSERLEEEWLDQEIECKEENNYHRYPRRWIYPRPSFPSFNSNSNKEFLFVNLSPETGYSKLFRYNLETEELSTLIEEFQILGRVDWSYPRHALYTSKDWNIWRFDLTTSYKYQVSVGEADLNSFSSRDGQYIFWQHSPGGSINHYLIRRDLTINKVDTLIPNEPIGAGKINFATPSSSNSAFVETLRNSRYVIGELNLSTLEFDPLIDLIEDLGAVRITGLCWSESENALYITAHQFGFGRLDLNTKELTKIRDYCWSNNYENISISKDGRFILAQKIESYIQTSESGFSSVIQESKICTFDVKRNYKEEVIELDI